MAVRLSGGEEAAMEDSDSTCDTYDEAGVHITGGLLLISRVPSSGCTDNGVVHRVKQTDV